MRFFPCGFLWWGFRGHMKHAVIQVRGLKIQFETQVGPHVIHEELDLDILQGEILGVVG